MDTSKRGSNALFDRGQDIYGEEYPITDGHDPVSPMRAPLEGLDPYGWLQKVELLTGTFVHTLAANITHSLMTATTLSDSCNCYYPRIRVL